VPRCGQRQFSLPGVTGCATPTPGCTPNCDRKVCGPDGCGGRCGTCGAVWSVPMASVRRAARVGRRSAPATASRTTSAAPIATVRPRLRPAVGERVSTCRTMNGIVGPAGCGAPSTSTAAVVCVSVAIALHLSDLPVPRLPAAWRGAASAPRVLTTSWIRARARSSQIAS
jgi:hypothetical protein